MLYPPRPSNITIPAVVTGNVIQNNNTLVSANENGFNESIVMKTQNTLAVLINSNQRASINTNLTNAMLTVNNNTALIPTIRLSYQNKHFFDGKVTEDGNVLFAISSSSILDSTNQSISFGNNLNVSNHNGSTSGLMLGGRLITASATEVNYVDVPPGVARHNKAVILNDDLDFFGINKLTTNLIGGVLLTPDQPNIAKLNNVNITGELLLKGNAFVLTPRTMSYITVEAEGIATAKKALVLDLNKNISGINNLSAVNITGVLGLGPQPNITSLTGLTALTNNGESLFNDTITITTTKTHLVLKSEEHTSSFNIGSEGNLTIRSSTHKIDIPGQHSLQVFGHDGITTGLILGSDLVVATGKQLNFNKVDVGIAEGLRSLVLDSFKNIRGINHLSSVHLTGIVNTPHQPMITSVNTFNISKHDGITGLSLNGVLVVSNATQLNSLNVTPGTAVKEKALVLDQNKDIKGIRELHALEVFGTLKTNIQPNITQVNTLTIIHHNGTTGLNLAGTLVTVSGNQINKLDVESGIAGGDKVLITDSNRNIKNINEVSAVKVFGVIQTPSQPHIQDVNTLNVVNHDGTTGLSLNGVLVTSTATQLNRLNVVEGVAMQNKALVLDSSFTIKGINHLEAHTIKGSLVNASQPNIRILSSINIIDHNGVSTGLSLNGTLITSTATQINYVNVQQGIAEPSKALVLSSTRSIENINVISANTINGVIRTEIQPYINRVSVLNIMEHNGSTSGLSLNGMLVTATAEQINYIDIEPGAVSKFKALVVDSQKNIQGINKLMASELSGVLLTSSQPNISSVNVLNVNNHNGSTGLSLSGILVTASAQAINRIDGTIGVATSEKALVVSTQRDIRNINKLSASILEGVLATEHQPNIKVVSSLNVLEHDGGTNGLSLGGKMIICTSEQLNFNSVFPGTATPNRSLVTNSFNSVNGINTLSAKKIVSDELALKGVISNFNEGAIIIKSYSFTDLTGRIVDVQLLDTLTFTQFNPAGQTSGYSSEMIGYIYPEYSENYTFFISCNDRVRVWVNGVLILHSWNKVSTVRTSASIFLNKDQWVSIYIQYQVDIGSIPSFTLEWASARTIRGRIPSSRLAWDNNAPAHSIKLFSQNSLTIFNTSTVGQNTASFTVDQSGDLVIDASGNDITLGTLDNFNIPVHDGSGGGGLYLGGVLVEPSAFELNYLKVNPGIALASHALVIDASKSIIGLNSVSANSIACTNLSTESFTINTLSLAGPLNNFNDGALLIRQLTGPDLKGRVVDVSTITDINLNNYDPRGLNTNYSLDIIGYVLPIFSEHFRFFAIANDRVRIWVNDKLILNAWDTSSGIEYASDPVFLHSGQYVPIYIQFQNVNGSSSLQVRWSSPSMVKTFINSSYMAWDNTVGEPPRAKSVSDTLTIFSGVSGLTSIQSGTIAVNGFGEMTLATKAEMISIDTTNSFNIQSHSGSSGLYLANQLVKASATELNYVAGVVPGTVVASKAIVLDATKSLSGLTTISTNNIIGLLQTPDQPNIRSIGALSSTLKSSSDIILSSTNTLRLACDSTACFIQTGVSTNDNSSSDLFIGNFNSTIASSFRKLMIKASGYVGIQTESPTRALTVNGEGAPFSMRLIHNIANGSETAFCDLGVDASSNLKIKGDIIIGSTATSSLSVNHVGIMKINPSGGSLQVGNTTNETMPLELGSNSFSISSEVGFLNSEGSVGSSISLETSYSLRTTASIIVNGTVCVTSDRRLKNDISKLNIDDCKDFILKSNPVQFKYNYDQLNHIHNGLIAQDVAKSKFANLVKIAPHENLQSDIDIDGYASPANAAYNVAYEEIIPILMTTMKSSIEENASLKSQVSDLTAQVNHLQDLVHQLLSSKEV